MTQVSPRSRVLALATLAVFALSGPLAAKEPLNTEKHINGSLVAAAIGALIQENCKRISPRYLTFYRKTKDLESYAFDQGYTKEEINAFLKDKTEQKRVKTEAETYLAAQGVVENNEATYCKAGRAEIDNGTLTGELLRAW